MEMIIAILFFSLAESYLALEGDINAMQDLFSPSEQISDDTLRLTFDSCWNLCSAENGGSYQAELVHTPTEGTGIMEAQITVYDLSAPEMPIYTISVMHHTAERRGDHE